MQACQDLLVVRKACFPKSASVSKQLSLARGAQVGLAASSTEQGLLASWSISGRHTGLLGLTLASGQSEDSSYGEEPSRGLDTRWVRKFFAEMS